MTSAQGNRVFQRKSLRRLTWISFAIALWLSISLLCVYRATRRPRSPYAEPAPRLDWAHRDLRSIKIITDDGENLGAWFLEGEKDRPCVLLLHGHRGSRGNCLPQAEIFAKMGCAVLLITLRAHGDSTGDYDDVGYGSRRDVLAAIRWLEMRETGQAIVVYGQSMGAAAATFAAAELGERVHGYILESPYRNLRTAVWNRLNANLWPPWNVFAYGGLAATAPLVIPHLDRIAPVDAAGGIPTTVPVLVLAGAPIAGQRLRKRTKWRPASARRRVSWSSRMRTTLGCKPCIRKPIGNVCANSWPAAGLPNKKPERTMIFPLWHFRRLLQ